MDEYDKRSKDLEKANHEPDTLVIFIFHKAPYAELAYGALPFQTGKLVPT